MNLAQYASSFEEEGYDDLRYLASLDERGLRRIAEAVQMKRGHAERFVAWMSLEASQLLQGVP